MNVSDTELIAEEEITQAASTQDTSFTVPASNLHVVLSENQSKKKKKTKKKNYGSVPKKLPSKTSVTSCQKYNPI